MNSKLLVCVITFCCIACKRTAQPHEPKKETPKALKERVFDRTLSSNSRENLLEPIYDELVEKDTALAALEKEIERLRKERVDSLKPFSTFDDKNDSYYADAFSYTGNISDSILRLKIKTLIEDSRKNYNTAIQKHLALLHAVSTKDTSLDDLHIVLKLVTTLPVIEQYQKDEIPATNTIEHLLKHYDNAIQKVTTVIGNEQR